jgi:hypothetical protein
MKPPLEVICCAAPKSMIRMPWIVAFAGLPPGVALDKISQPATVLFGMIRLTSLEHASASTKTRSTKADSSACSHPIPSLPA